MTRHTLVASLADATFGSIVAGEVRCEGDSRPVVDPSTATTVARWVTATERDVDDALDVARASVDHGPWRRMPPLRRAEVLEAAADELHARAAGLAALESLDTGKSVHGAETFDLYEAETAFRHAAAVCRTATGDVRRSSYPPELFPAGGPDVLTVRVREPAGVVVELLPWNAPLMTGSQRLAAALAAGCSVVAKPPEEAVMTTSRLVALLHRVGVPVDVVQLVLGAGETVGERLIDDPRVDLISLTGSVPTGRRVAELAGRRLAATHLELGGKAPVIVCADADVEAAARWAAMAAFVNGGQVCVAGSRLLVHRSRHDEVVAAVIEHARQFRIGDALDPTTFIGPLVTAEHAAEVRRRRDTAISSGDAVAHGAVELPTGLPSTFVAPSVLSAVRQGSELEQQEIFGPVLAAMSFESDDEAIALANGTQYGLNATVFTQSLRRAFRFSAALDVGEVNVNCHFTPDMNGLKGAPRRASGLGLADVEAYSTAKALNINTIG